MSKNTFPTTWLVTASSSCTADATFRCWSLSDLRGSPPFLLYEFTSPGHVPFPLSAPSSDTVHLGGGGSGSAGTSLLGTTTRWFGGSGSGADLHHNASVVTPGVVVGYNTTAAEGGREERRREDDAGGGGVLWGGVSKKQLPQQPPPPPQSVSPFSPFAPSSANALVRLLGVEGKDASSKDSRCQPPSEETLVKMELVGPSEVITVRGDGVVLLNRL